MEKKHNIDKFQGYPHYPASEDIMRAKNNNGREPIDPEVKPKAGDNPASGTGDGVGLVTGTDADLTAEDLLILEGTAQNTNSLDDINLIRSSLDITDMDGDPLNEAGMFNDVSGNDLDVPGGADDTDAETGGEDEENDYYSLGGDNHESQEEYKGD